MATGFATVFSGRSATESELFVSTEERQWSGLVRVQLSIALSFVSVYDWRKNAEIYKIEIMTEKRQFSTEG